MTANRRMITVVTVLLQSPSRFWRMHGRKPSVGFGAARGAIGWKTAAMSALLDRRPSVVPTHERRRRERSRQIYGHDDGDALDRASGLIEGSVCDRNNVRITDRHRKRRVLGEIEVLAGH